MSPLKITHYTATSALGRGREAHWQALQEGRSGLRRRAFEICALDCWVGEVDGLEQPLTGALAVWDCRNNRLAQLGLEQDGFAEVVAYVRERYRPGRVGVFMGTSTSGVQQAELAYRARDRNADSLPDWFRFQHTQNTYSVADFVRRRLGLEGPSIVISTACSSSAKVFASAQRAIQSELCDAAVVGGVDSLCLTTLYGFNSLQLVSADICRPADAERAGLSIGEAAGFAIVERADAGTRLALLGCGESSDAYHMSRPDPEGRGATAAMRGALESAGMQPEEIDYVNLHGTATPANDIVEDKAVCMVLGTRTPCSSTKGWTGHALGAAGILEAVIALLCMEGDFMPRSLNTQRKDPQIHGNILLESRSAATRRVLSNSFGFGGSNCSLLLGKLA